MTEISNFQDIFDKRILCVESHSCIEYLPDWVQIYFVKNGEEDYKCNVCEMVIIGDEKCLNLLKHITENHKDIYELHKENADSAIGFEIEFLQLNVVKDDEPKVDTMILTDVSDTVQAEVDKEMSSKDVRALDMHYVLLPRKKKLKRVFEFSRKRSWVWKYFDKLSNIIYRCNLCSVVLSIKKCNTNNMNRHVRSRHPSIYKSEVEKKQEHTDIEIGSEMETTVIKSEDVISDKDLDESLDNISKHRRSWIWSYFKRVSSTLAQCTLCNRNISHGGNSTGNMNRHLKMIHHKTGDDTSWVWKVFEGNEQDFYWCKICQFKCMKFDDTEKSLTTILDHLKMEHGVISGEQIITGMEYDIEEN